jgi:hypothetical protein
VYVYWPWGGVGGGTRLEKRFVRLDEEGLASEVEPAADGSLVLEWVLLVLLLLLLLLLSLWLALLRRAANHGLVGEMTVAGAGDGVVDAGADVVGDVKPDAGVVVVAAAAAVVPADWAWELDELESRDRMCVWV